MRTGDIGALAHEVPYWGWVDAQTCLTLGGELVTVGRLAPVAVDGRSAGDLDAVAGRWHHMLSGLPDGMRVTWMVERRPMAVPDPTGGPRGHCGAGATEATRLPGGPCARGCGACGLVLQPSAAARGRAAPRPRRVVARVRGALAAPAAHPA